MNIKNKILFIVLSIIMYGCANNSGSLKNMELGYTSKLGVVSKVYAPLPRGKSPEGYITFGEIITSFSRANPSLSWDSSMMVFVNQFTNKKVSPMTNADQSIQIQDVGEWFVRWGD